MREAAKTAASGSEAVGRVEVKVVVGFVTEGLVVEMVVAVREDHHHRWAWW